MASTHDNPAFENLTLDPSLTSWVESANDPASDFPIQNLPLCAFVDPEGYHAMGARIGDKVADLGILAEGGVISHEHDGHACHVFDQGYINAFLAHGPGLWHEVRRQLQGFLAEGAAGGQQARRLREKALHDVRDVEMTLPMVIGDYTDFYASVHHATNVGSMFRPDQPLLPNYKHIPIGYHGRSSSIVPSGTGVVRPRGQTSPPEDQPGAGPGFGPCQMLDYELELGAVVGTGNEMGEPIPISRAWSHVFGLCILNDWSARDVQKWEYQPLGPFLAKNFASTISPYVVSLEALEPFRVPAEARAPGDPTALAYLLDPEDRARGGLDIRLEVSIESRAMREKGLAPHRLSLGNFRHMYWTIAQMLAHHASNGCPMRPGDLLGSGTISGPEPASRGCLLELTWAGRDESGKPRPRAPVVLPSGEKRLFLADDDTVVIRAWCERPGYRRIGFGECRGTILPARG